MRGEQLLDLDADSACPGSSPRARGAGDPGVDLDGGDGVIPACAGSRREPPSADHCDGGHPRGCGEQWSRSTVTPSATGSSPRVRGAVESNRVRAGVAGVIPAGAGSSRIQPCSRRSGRGHPRGCGEQCRLLPCGAGRWGSSPRVRGAVPLAALRGRPVGVIPAGAGSSVPPPRRARGAGGHPRGCGEQVGSSPIESLREGSSPRVRGAGFTRRDGCPPLGVIPAGAGSSLNDLPL
ncbi:conserved hypothetical protein [Streptomyces sp. Mg1]|nr:conserved hypothetical protein [Streptomyces sp. Mg1]